MKPTLVFDIDGVTLRWSSQLIPFLQSKGLATSTIVNKINNNEYLDLNMMGFDAIFEYHRSPFIEHLHPFETTNVPLIIELATRYNLVALTSFSADPHAQQARIRNLTNHYQTSFSEVIILPTLASKKEALFDLNRKFDVKGFIDDSPKHVHESLAVLGYERTVWFNSFNHSDVIDCKQVSSLAEFESSLLISSEQLSYGP